MEEAVETGKRGRRPARNGGHASTERSTGWKNLVADVEDLVKKVANVDDAEIAEIRGRVDEDDAVPGDQREARDAPLPGGIVSRRLAARARARGVREAAVLHRAERANAGPLDLRGGFRWRRAGDDEERERQTYEGPVSRRSTPAEGGAFRSSVRFHERRSLSRNREHRSVQNPNATPKCGPPKVTYPLGPYAARP